LISQTELEDQHLRKRASSRRQYAKRKAEGLCAYSGCRTLPEAGHVHCPRHLMLMARNNRARVLERKAKGLCIYCGERPQFWSVRCVICRQLFVRNKHSLPAGARRALRLYREAERKRELEQLQLQARFSIRKLLATGTIRGDYARALKLYTGLDDGAWRTYSQVAKVMHISKERVRQLLYPSKLILTEMLGGNTPWPPLSTKKPVSGKEKSWRRPRWLDSSADVNCIVVPPKHKNRSTRAETYEAEILRLRRSAALHAQINKT
jgi:hypothetical protein